MADTSPLISSMIDSARLGTAEKGEPINKRPTVKAASSSQRKRQARTLTRSDRLEVADGIITGRSDIYTVQYVMWTGVARHEHGPLSENLRRKRRCPARLRGSQFGRMRGRSRMGNKISIETQENQRGSCQGVPRYQKRFASEQFDEAFPPARNADRFRPLAPVKFIQEILEILGRRPLVAFERQEASQLIKLGIVL